MGEADSGERVLCKGNRTEVVLVERDGRAIVLKRLLCFADVSPERAALYYEGLVQHGARGPGVVPVIDGQFEAIDALHDLGEVPGESRVIERAFVPGASLKDLIREDKRACLSSERCRMWIASLCSTLDRIHHLRGMSGDPLHLIHRDVTLGNVLVGETALSSPIAEGDVWLNDFGLAHAAAWGRLDLEETLQGAARFLAPELKAGQQPAWPSDVYQAGLLLATLLGACEGGKVSDLFDVGFSNPANARARALLARYGAEATLEQSPSARPTAAELGALLRA